MSIAVQSPTEALMNLGAANDGSLSSASLALVATSGADMKVISEVNIAGLLAPDLLSYSVSASMGLMLPIVAERTITIIIPCYNTVYSTCYYACMWVYNIYII